MQDNMPFIIRRIVTQNSLPSSVQGRIEFATECLKRVCEDISESVTVLQTPGGFLFDCQDLRTPHSISKCNTRRSDFKWCFKPQTLSGAVVDQ